MKKILLGLLMILLANIKPVNAQEKNVLTHIKHYEDCERLEKEIPELKDFCEDELYLLDVIYYETQTGTIADLLDDQNELHEKIKAGIPIGIDHNKVLAEIYNRSNCMPPILYYPATQEFDVSEELNCEQMRFGYISQFKLDNIYKLQELLNILRNSEIVKDYQLEVNDLNKNLIYIYNTEPIKGLVIKNKKYWEKLNILVSMDENFIVFIIEGKYAAGVNKPDDDEFRLSNAKFHDDFFEFFMKLKNQITNQ